MSMEQLPEFEVVRVEDKKRGTVRCPRRGCKGEFTVDRKKFKTSWYWTDSSGKKVLMGTKPCPYCFRAARTPGTPSAR